MSVPPTEPSSEPATSPDAPPAAETATRRPRGRRADVAGRRTRTGAVWTALAGGLAVLIVLLVFIFQNLQDVTITFFGWTGRVPLALGLLAAAVLGALVVLIAGSARIVQLRRAARRTHREHERRLAG